MEYVELMQGSTLSWRLISADGGWLAEIKSRLLCQGPELEDEEGEDPA